MKQKAKLPTFLKSIIKPTQCTWCYFVLFFIVFFFFSSKIRIIKFHLIQLYELSDFPPPIIPLLFVVVKVPFLLLFLTLSHYNTAWRSVSGVFINLPIISMSLSIDQISAAKFPHTFLSCGIDLTCIHHNTILLFFCVTFPQLSSSPLIFLHQAGM